MLDPKPAKRIRDAGAARAFRMAGGDECCCCGVTSPLNVHHLVLRSRGGDDTEGNFVLLCGSGTTGCHGRFHSGDQLVRRAIGLALKPVHIGYVHAKFGEASGNEFLLREYSLETKGDGRAHH